MENADSKFFMIYYKSIDKDLLKLVNKQFFPESIKSKLQLLNPFVYQFA